MGARTYSGEGQTSSPFPNKPHVPYWQQARDAFKNPQAKAEIESEFYRQNKYIDRLDPDLENKKSFSIAAKIAFQRQRIVADAMDREQQNPEDRFSKFRKWLNP
jgi:hypothetical protein